MNILIGNIIGLIGSLFMVTSGFQKTKKKILFYQNLELATFIISNIVLGGISGAIVDAFGLARNILCYKDKFHLKEKIILTFTSIIFIVIFNNLGVIGLLPLMSTLLYIWFISIKSIKKFKLIFSLAALLWLIYDIYINSYVSSIFDAMTMLASLITIKSAEEYTKTNKKYR